MHSSYASLIYIISMLYKCEYKYIQNAIVFDA